MTDLWELPIPACASSASRFGRVSPRPEATEPNPPTCRKLRRLMPSQNCDDRFLDSLGAKILSIWIKNGEEVLRENELTPIRPQSTLYCSNNKGNDAAALKHTIQACKPCSIRVFLQVTRQIKLSSAVVLSNLKAWQ